MNSMLVTPHFVRGVTSNEIEVDFCKLSYRTQINLG